VKTKFNPSEAVGEMVIFNSQSYQLVKFLSDDQGKRGFTFEAVCEESNHRVCCKFYPEGKLHEKWKEEFQKPNRIQSDDIAKYIGDITATIQGLLFVVILFEWVDGFSLKKYITDHPEKITIDFILTFATWILSPLQAFTSRNTYHGDLHLGNVMISVAGEDSLEPGKTSFKLIDFGISFSDPEMQPRDDFKSTARIIAQLLLKVSPESLDLSDKFIFDRLPSGYLKLLNEEEPDRADSFKNPRKLWAAIRSIEEEAKNMKAGNTGKNDRLANPFDLLSADRFRDDSPLLYQLFFAPRSLQSHILSSDTVVLTGPRGCGKTMILRNLSLKTHLNSTDGETLPDHIGFYLSSFELWMAFPHRREDDTHSADEIATDAFQLRAIHYFHLCLIEEILSTLFALRLKRPELITIGQITAFANHISSEFRDYTSSPSADLLSDLKSTVESWRATFRKEPSSYVPKEGVAFLRDLCRALRSIFPFVKDRQIFFLIDDYSLGKVTPALQLSLNRIIFQRNSEFQFKVGAEKSAILLRDVDGPLDPSRTYHEHDMGYFFIDPDAAEERLETLKTIFDKRLQYTDGVKYTSLESILGTTQYESFTQFARVLTKPYNGTESDPLYLKKPLYHGLGFISEICSGDIAAILSLIQRIFIQSKFDALTDQSIPIDIQSQDHAIKDYSRDFLEHVGGEQLSSQKVRQVAKAFGEMAKWKLENQTSSNEGTPKPFQVCRLEVYEDEEMSVSASELFRLLLRYGIFIQVPRGFSQDGGTSLRLFLRRLFLPTFGLSFSRRDCIRIHMDEFSQLLNEPEVTSRQIIDRWVSESSSSAIGPTLFDNDTR
jgi:serine/threonine protein kinase